MRALVAVIVTLCIGTPAALSEPAVPQSREEIALSLAPLVERVAPAVVNIYAKRLVRERVNPLLDDPFFRRFFGDRFGGRERKREVPSLGSGVIVEPEGLIVTNRHVIEGAENITVVLNDRREFEATVVLSDEETDLAVLSIDPGEERLPTLELRDADTLKVGDFVIAIGNPFGVGQTVTSGIISGLARSTITDSGSLQSFIQTDAAINPGNSGGALVTLDGRLAGINSAILSSSGGSHGVGFAIPSNLVAAVVKGARTGSGIVRPWVGLVGQDLTAELAASVGRELPGGILVNEVYPGGPADRAGLRPGDAIVGIDGRPVRDPGEFQFRVATESVGGTAELTIWRRGKEITVRLPLEPPPEEPPRNVTELTGEHPLQGAEVANLSPALSQELDFDPMARGVVVLRLRRGGHAARFGVQPGDIVAKVNERPVERVGGLDRMLSDVETAWTIELRRGGELLTIKARRES